MYFTAIDKLTHDEKTITEVHFVIDDANVLFYDFDAFGSLIDARPFIEQIVRANRLNREIPIGPYPEIFYFTGKREIFSADTVLGRISASHQSYPYFRWSGWGILEEYDLHKHRIQRSVHF